MAEHRNTRSSSTSTADDADDELASGLSSRMSGSGSEFESTGGFQTADEGSDLINVASAAGPSAVVVQPPLLRQSSWTPLSQTGSSVLPVRSSGNGSSDASAANRHRSRLDEILTQSFSSVQYSIAAELTDEIKGPHDLISRCFYFLHFSSMICVVSIVMLIMETTQFQAELVAELAVTAFSAVLGLVLFMLNLGIESFTIRRRLLYVYRRVKCMIFVCLILLLSFSASAVMATVSLRVLPESGFRVPQTKFHFMIALAAIFNACLCLTVIIKAGWIYKTLYIYKVTHILARLPNSQRVSAISTEQRRSSRIVSSHSRILPVSSAPPPNYGATSSTAAGKSSLRDSKHSQSKVRTRRRRSITGTRRRSMSHPAAVNRYLEGAMLHRLPDPIRAYVTLFCATTLILKLLSIAQLTATAMLLTIDLHNNSAATTVNCTTAYCIGWTYFNAQMETILLVFSSIGGMYSFFTSIMPIWSFHVSQAQRQFYSNTMHSVIKIVCQLVVTVFACLPLRELGDGEYDNSPSFRMRFVYYVTIAALAAVSILINIMRVDLTWLLAKMLKTFVDMNSRPTRRRDSISVTSHSSVSVRNYQY